MGHLAGKDLYRRLGEKIDGLTVRAPMNDAFRSILKELYSEEEADLVVRMPFGLATADRIGRCSGRDRATVERLLEQLCAKGLVVDVRVGNGYRYIPSPLVIGIFEFTMMRTGEGLDTKRWARLFHEYIESGAFWSGNLGDGQQLYLMRSLPHEQAIATAEGVEVLDYERATAIVDSHERFAIGICSCRHEKLHVGEKKCDVPLMSCTSMGNAVDFLVRRGLAKEVGKAEVLEQLDRSREMGLVLNADGVRRDVGFICHCCGCCCNVLLGISRFGYPHAVLTSSFIAEVDDVLCEGCGKCKKACPIQAISLERLPQPRDGRQVRAKVDGAFCLGCGVCALRCETRALKLRKRERRVIHPETTFERMILQCLEIGNLQNLLFDDPDRVTHRFMRAFVGGVLRLPPVKRALLGDVLRSRFLAALASGAARGGEAGAAGA
jgi:ferredoxin